MSSNARDGRRRRMLQEEVMSTSRDLAAYDPDKAASVAGEGRRYAFVEGSLGGALARRHFPGAITTPIACMFAAFAAVAGVAALHHYRHAISTSLGSELLPLLDVTSPSSLGNWLASTALLMVAIVSCLIWSVRRRRVDDYRGRHRLWRGAVVAAVLLSIDSATSLHTAFAALMSHVTGIALLAGGAEWWLLPTILLAGWVGVSVLLDVRESRLGLTFYLGALAAYSVALLSHVGWLPAALGSPAAVTATTLLAGHLLLVTTLVGYARFLRRDVEAGVASRPQKSRAAEKQASSGAAVRKSEPKSSKNDTPTITFENNNRKNPPTRDVQPAPAVTQWTDGSDGGDEAYDDEGAPRKLSKAERKQLRKIKAQRRAA